VKVSDTLSPTFSASKAESAVYVQAPSAAMLKVPLAPCTPVCATYAGALSTSEMASCPLATSGASVSLSATTSLESTAASLLPAMVTCTLVAVPSAAATVKVSDTLSPTFSASKAESAVYVQAPSAAMLKVPLAPCTPVCATYAGALSTSEMASCPLATSGASVSLSATTSLESTAASLLPAMVTCTLVAVPSAAATVKVSDTLSPTFSASKAESAVYVQAPSAAMLKVPLAPCTPVCATYAGALSTSEMASCPLATSGASVSLSATTSLESTAASLLPAMVTCTLVAVPSAAATVKVSDTLSPTFSASKAESAVYVQAPSAAMLKVPLAPCTPVCATYAGALSTSEMASCPLATSGASVSLSATTSLESTAASLLPAMVTCTLVAVPSAAATVKVSDTLSPTFSASKAESAVYVQAPSAAMLKVPLAPCTPVCATYAGALSTSEMASCPLATSGASVSLSATTSLESTAASL